MAKEFGRDEYTVCDQCRAKKIRCGREKPTCANCNRVGSQCEWSGQGKKCNQTTLLSHTILGMSSRLQQLENSIAEMQRSWIRIFEEPSVVSAISLNSSASPPRPTPQPSPQPFSDSVKRAVYTRPLGRFSRDQNDNIRCFASTSLESLMLSIKDELSESIDAESSTLEECVLQAQHKIDFLVGQGEEEFLGETALPTAPPFAILEAMIEPYFATVNYHFPIWTKERFAQMAATLRQSTPHNRDIASIICCNNLILMAMSADLIDCNRKESAQASQTRKASGIDFDIIAGFLTNAKRAVKNIGQLVAPRLINVQALLSLYMVAQEHFSISISETLLALAARCANSIGIHQWHSFQGQLGDEDIQERRNISYCLYIFDKVICWTAGSSPNIPFSDVHSNPCLLSVENDTTFDLGTKFKLAKIEEMIYLEIYAIQIKAKNEDQIRELANTILSSLQGWLNDAGIDLDKLQKFPENSASNLLLAIRYLCVQLLLIWPYKHHPDVIFQRGQEIAKMCMKLLLRLWHSSSDQGNQAIFPFFLASLQPLYIYEILSSVLYGKGSSSDIDMLREFVEMLQTITDCRGESSYNQRLYQLSLIATDVIKTRESQHKRKKSNFERPTKPYSITELFPPDMSRFNCMNLDVQETESSNSGNSQPQDPDSCFSFMSPIDSTGELGRSLDEFSPHLESYTNTVSGVENLNYLTLESLHESCFLENQ